MLKHFTCIVRSWKIRESAFCLVMDFIVKNFLNQSNPLNGQYGGVSAAAIIVCFFCIWQYAVSLFDRRAYRCNGIGVGCKGTSRWSGADDSFSVFYGVISYSCRYYGEMITYLAMTALWLWRRLSHGCAILTTTIKRSQSKRIVILRMVFFAALSIVVTIVFYFILRALNTANLIVSDLSVLLLYGILSHCAPKSFLCARLCGKRRSACSYVVIANG